MGRTTECWGQRGHTAPNYTDCTILLGDGTNEKLQLYTDAEFRGHSEYIRAALYGCNGLQLGNKFATPHGKICKENCILRERIVTGGLVLCKQCLLPRAGPGAGLHCWFFYFQLSPAAEAE